MLQTAIASESIPLSVVLPMVDRILDRTCRRLSREDAEDLASHVRLRLIENDHAILRRFGGRSSWRTYLTVVVRRLVLDYRTHSWGKYRPSAQARRLGPTAMTLERLIQRDGFTPDEAIAILEVDLRVGTSRAELHRLETLLPIRTARRRIADTELRDIACDGFVEERILDAERAGAIQRAQSALAVALAKLRPQDRLILRLRFESGFPVRQIADTLQMQPRPLYRRIDGCLRRLRREVEREGLTRESLALVVGCSCGAMRVDLATGSILPPEEPRRRRGPLAASPA